MKWRILPIGLAGSQSTLEGYAMKKCTASSSSGPEATVPDPLTELLRKGARDLIAKAVEAELEALLEDCSSLRLEDGRAAVVRNGYLPGRAVQTGIGDVEVRVPKVRDRSGSGIVFNSSLLPPYLKRAKNVEEFLPWLYLKGVSTGGYGEALHSLLGENAKGLSANTISRLKEKWTEEHQEWNRRDLSGKKYVYWWADGVYSRVRMDDKLCLLVIIGTTEKGEKELVAVEDGYRESEARVARSPLRPAVQGTERWAETCRRGRVPGILERPAERISGMCSSTVLGPQDGERAEQSAEIAPGQDEGGPSRDLDGRDEGRSGESLRQGSGQIRGQIPQGD